MKTRHIGLLLLLAVASSASAKDLEARIGERQASLTGKAIESASGSIRRVQQSPRFTGPQLRARLQSAGLIQSTVDDQRSAASWEDALDDTGRRRSLLRRMPDQQGQRGSRYRSLKDYHAKQLAFTDETLVAKAARIAQEVAAAEALLGPGEELRPEQTSVLRFHSDDASGNSGNAQDFVMSATVVLRRYINGVAVLADDGDFSIEFDAADGSLIELNVPTSRYQLVPPAASARSEGAGSGRGKLERGLAALGFAQTVQSLGQQVVRKGETVRIRDIRCGFVELQGQSDLRPGCEVATTGRLGGEVNRFTTE